MSDRPCLIRFMKRSLTFALLLTYDTRPPKGRPLDAACTGEVAG
jgi:hypothetical protein